MKEGKLIKDIISQAEDEQLEFKESARLDTIGRVICAFLNNNGGQLIVGVKDDKEIIGVANPEKQVKVITEFLNREIVPEAPVTVSIESINDKAVISITVWPGSKKPYIFLGAVYYRKGTATARATTKELSAIIHDRSQTEFQWERLPVTGIELEDFDLLEIRRAMALAPNLNMSQDPINEPLDFLSYYGLYQNGSFTNASVILFARQPSRFIPQARTRVSVLQEGKTADQFLYDRVLEGNLFQKIAILEDFFSEISSFNRQFEQLAWRRKDSLFPIVAVREGIINALVHTDYSVVNGSISVILYSDKLEISNFGNLPMPVSELKKNHLSMPPNPDIAHMVFLMGFMEKIGRGTLKIVEACKEAGLKSPVWKNINNTVILSFSNERSDINKGAFKGLIEGAIERSRFTSGVGIMTEFALGMNALVPLLGTAASFYTDKVKENLILLITSIYQNEGRRVPDYAEVTRMSLSTIERYIKILRDADLVEFQGDAAQVGGYYLTDKTKRAIVRYREDHDE